MFAPTWRFLRGVVSVAQLPAPDVPEVAFAGRSNVGKSSLINAVLGQKSIARTSNTPGRTQELNYFVEAGDLYIVDLPGYGYARAPKKRVKAWTGLIFDYLRGRANLRRLFLLIDARHGLKAKDLEVMEMLDSAAIAYQIVLTKADKIKAGEVEAMVEGTAGRIVKRPAAHPRILVTSAQKGDGIDELRGEIADIASP